MLPFLFGQAAVLVAVAAVALYNNRVLIGYAPWDYLWKPIILLLALPLLGAWIAAEGARLVRPSRLLDSRVKGVLGRAFTGFAAGVLAFTLTLFAVRFVSGWIAEAGVTTGASILATLLFARLSARQRPGCCVHCRYDLASITPAAGGRCPECGNSVCGA